MVHLPWSTFVEQKQNSRRNVCRVDVEAGASSLLVRIGMDLDGAPLEHRIDDLWDEFLRMLTLTERVHDVDHDSGDFIRVLVRQHQLFARGL